MKPGFATCENLSAENRQQVKSVDPHDTATEPLTAWSLTQSTQVATEHFIPAPQVPHRQAFVLEWLWEGWMSALAASCTDPLSLQAVPLSSTGGGRVDLP